MMHVVIDIHEKDYQSILNSGHVPYSVVYAIMNGTPLPKGHGRLINADNITSITLEDSLHCLTWEKDSEIDCYIDAPTIIEADNKYEAKSITRGNCMMCGKELTEGLFFCKECEGKGNSRKE